MDTPEGMAQLLATKWEIGLNGSVLIANPIPAAYEMAPALIETHIQQALDDAAQQNIKGKEVTPFILQHIASHTQGESLEANIALIKNNARVAAEIAVAMHKLK
jgi:pseudouridine-5'-phosphate glycosidase